MEFLAPAGSWEAFLAAVNNGADAVYIGGQHFSARQAATNFDPPRLEEAVQYAHQRGRRVYVAVNTLIDGQEFESALDYLFQLAASGVDAVILQDMGLLQAAASLLPGLRIHASTQMNTHNQDGAALLKRLGVSRIVLARELSADEIQVIHRASAGVELEVFVHGALCFSYSGQCLFSSVVGGRSGNRGRCAQPCRLPYALCQEGRRIQIMEPGRYRLSPADLCLIDHLPLLASSGVTALKIEGRMRRPEYVAVVTKAYRQVLDRLQEDPGYKVSTEIKQGLRAIFNRGYTTGHLVDAGQPLMNTITPKNKGILVGQVLQQSNSYRTSIELSEKVCLGDGLAVWAGADTVRPLILREIRSGGQRLTEAGPGLVIEVKLDGPVSPSNPVYKTHDQELLNQARRTISAEPPPRIGVDAEVFLVPGEKMQLVLQAQGHRVQAESQHPLQPARTQALDEEVIRQKIGRLGDSRFTLNDLRVTGDSPLSLPFSEINALRRRAVDLLTRELGPLSSAWIAPEGCPADKTKFLTIPRTCGAYPARLTVAVSDTEAAAQALDAGADRVYLGIDGMGSGHRIDQQQLEKFALVTGNDGGRVVPLLPRIHQPADGWNYREAVRGGSNLMISSWADLEWAGRNQFQFYIDYNMNVFNPYTLRMLVAKGAAGITLSPELSWKQLAAFPDLSQAELLVHGELILMQSQHCLIGPVRAPGPPACEWACRRGDYSLQDQRGYSFPLETDSDCRQYIFNSRPLCLMEDLDRILDLHPAAIRIEARRERPGQVRALTSLYREALDALQAGRRPTLKKYQQRLAAVSTGGFTKGHYFRGVL
ncbi:MAG: U32 family peptidase [Syntrophomonas sp.]|nr:U32 family peptidase [Syntrophomonas sp.]